MGGDRTIGLTAAALGRRRVSIRSRRMVGVAVLVPLMVTAACSSNNHASSPTTSGLPSTASTSGQAATGGSTDGTWNPDGAAADASTLACASNKPADDHRGITDTSIKIGGLGTVTGPTVATFGDSNKGAMARFMRTNDSGGINGRKIDYRGMADDGLDSTRGIDAARRLAESDKVFAVAPLMTQIASYADVLCQDVVPYVGWGFNTGFCGNTVGFGFDGCLLPTNFPYSGSNDTQTRALLGEHPTIALLGNDDDAAKRGNATVKKLFEHAGIRVTYSQNLLPDGAPLTDPSPIVNDVMTSDGGGPPGAIYLVADFSNTNTMVQAFKGAGYRGKLIDAVAYDPRLATAPQYDDTYVTLLWAPVESNVPFTVQMQADIQKYASGTPLSLPTMAGYISADFLIAALQKAGRDLTVSGFLSVMNGGGYTYQQAGFVGETYWPLNHLTGTPCGSLVHLQAHKYSPVGAPLVCGNLQHN